MAECIFCKIIGGKLPAFRIYEDDFAIGILDIYPNIKGQALVISKKHLDGNIFALEDTNIALIMTSTKKVATLLERKLAVKAVHAAFEGEWVQHLHAKLYPAVGANKEFRDAVGEESIYFDSYPGYITTIRGPRASDDSLVEVQKEILSK
jgi:diadenosine tetraphosphate (Ap4A) HIT family hydrolase